MAFGADEERPVRTWFFRVVSLGGLVAVVVSIGVFIGKGNSQVASMLLFVGLAYAILFSWSWTGSIFSLFASSKRYVEGVEGDERHEWYAFKGQRVRAFLDDEHQPWFPVSEIAQILELKGEEKVFRNYSPREYGKPEFAPETCLSALGLKRLYAFRRTTSSSRVV